jgi:hypothetical protein
MDHLLFLAPTPKAASVAFSQNAPRTYDEEFSKVIIDWLETQLR